MVIVFLIIVIFLDFGVSSYICLILNIIKIELQNLLTLIQTMLKLILNFHFLIEFSISYIQTFNFIIIITAIHIYFPLLISLDGIINLLLRRRTLWMIKVMNTRIRLALFLWQVAFVPDVLVYKSLIDFQRYEFILIWSGRWSWIFTCHILLLILLKNRICQLYFLLWPLVGCIVAVHIIKVFIFKKLIQIFVNVFLFYLKTWFAVVIGCGHCWTLHVTELTNTLDMVILFPTYDRIIVIVFN